MANRFLESFRKADKKLKETIPKNKYPSSAKKLLLTEITKLNKVLKKDSDNKEAFYAKDSLLEELDFVEGMLGLPEAKTPLSQEGELRKMQKKAGGGKIYAMNRRMGGPIRKPRMK